MNKLPRIKVPTAKQQKNWDKMLTNILVMMLGLPVKVMAEEYGWDDTRLEQFADDISYAYETISKDQMNFDTVMNALSEESGIVMKDVLEKHNALSSTQDIGFMFACSLSVMILMDTQGFSDEQAKDYADKLAHHYGWVKRGYTSIYDLKRCLKKHTGMQIVEGTKSAEAKEE